MASKRVSKRPTARREKSLAESSGGNAQDDRPGGRRRLTPLAGAAALLVLILVGAWMFTRPSVAGRPGAPRHVIIISMDTTRPDHFGCYGNKWIRTPEVDALADESILFSSYLTTATTTLASHTSLFTGKYPHRHGVPRNGYRVSPANVMLAELLGDAGFECAGFIGAFVLHGRFNFAQGFDHFDQSFTRNVDWEDGTHTQERVAETVTDAVLKYAGTCDQTRRQFLFVHYFDAHAPYVPPPPYDTMYGDGEIPGQLAVAEHPTSLYGTQSRELRQSFYYYAGEISYMDAHIGRLLDGLRAVGMLDDAVLVLTSDHGENLCDVRGWPMDHGWTVYDTEARAVCLLRLPKAEQGGTVCDAIVSSTDILPTIADYLGFAVPDGVQGEALDLAHLDKLSPERTRFCEATKPWRGVEEGEVWFNARKAHCVRRGNFKYISTPHMGAEELYDLSKDPYERDNLLENPADLDAALVADLRTALRGWTASAAPLPTMFEQQQRDDTIRRLRSLGYLSDDPNGDG